MQVSSTSYACATIDSDGDGIPDGWESFYGLNPNDLSDANQDHVAFGSAVDGE